jgi:hypothetical protein
MPAAPCFLFPDASFAFLILIRKCVRDQAHRRTNNDPPTKTRPAVKQAGFPPYAG